MGLRSNAATRFKFGPTFWRLIPNNPDGGINSPARVVSDGPGPFDFSDAAVPAAVTVGLKLDNGSVLNETLDLSSVGNIAAVTAAELATAWTAAELATAWTGTVESPSGYFKIAKTTPGSARYAQVTGEVALYTGMRATIIPSDNQKSIAVANVNVDQETIETIDSNGLRTAILTDAYPTGATLTVTDATFDQSLKAAIEGGVLVDVAGFAASQYQSPGPSSVKPEFTIETFNAQYLRDTQQASSIAGYIWRRYESCKGSVGDEAGDRNFQDGVYNISAVPYRDPLTLVKNEYVYTEQVLTVAEYQSLHVTEV